MSDSIIFVSLNYDVLHVTPADLLRHRRGPARLQSAAAACLPAAGPPATLAAARRPPRWSPLAPARVHYCQLVGHDIAPDKGFLISMHLQ